MNFKKISSNIILNVSYHQISVFKSGLENPFNDWEDDHIAQGFSWRKESVSFKTLSSENAISIYIKIEDSITIFDNSTRAIMVPFDLNNSNIVEIASILDSIEIEIPNGRYSLVFQTGIFKDKEEWCLLSFIRIECNEAKILKADRDITKTDNFLMEAVPAI